MKMSDFWVPISKWHARPSHWDTLVAEWRMLRLGCLFTNELESCNFVSISICGIDHFGSDWIFFVIKTKDLEYRSEQNWCTTSC